MMTKYLDKTEQNIFGETQDCASATPPPDPYIL